MEAHKARKYYCFVDEGAGGTGIGARGAADILVEAGKRTR
jgi:hypothetical protein